jgi:hypothetical protein
LREPFARCGNLAGHIGRVLDHCQRERNTDLGCGKSDPHSGQVGVHGVE